MTTSITDHMLQHQTCKTKTTVRKTKTNTDFFCSQTGLVVRPTVSDHITDFTFNNKDSDQACLYA